MAKTTDPNSFAAFHRALASFLPPARLLTDPLRTLAFGTDASFYRLIPKMVIKTETAAEISRILNLCREQAVSVTFRAAGTSLSGQAVTDSVLLIAGENWKKIRVHGQGETVTLEPGVTADVAIFDLAQGNFEFVDIKRRTRVGHQKFVPVATVKSGKLETLMQNRQAR